MKIEVKDEEVRNQIEDAITKAVSDAITILVQAKVNSWTNEIALKKQVDATYSSEVTRIVAEEYAKVETIREKVREEIERKLRNQISRIMRDGANNG